MLIPVITKQFREKIENDMVTDFCFKLIDTLSYRILYRLRSTNKMCSTLSMQSDTSTEGYHTGKFSIQTVRRIIILLDPQLSRSY